MKEYKERALRWIDNFYKQSEESLHHDLLNAVNNKDVPSIMYLAERLGNLKEQRAIVTEQVLDAEVLLELIQLVMEGKHVSGLDDEEIEDYILYICK
jgi:hypothetical protein